MGIYLGCTGCQTAEQGFEPGLSGSRTKLCGLILKAKYYTVPGRQRVPTHVCSRPQKATVVPRPAATERYSTIQLSAQAWVSLPPKWARPSLGAAASPGLSRPCRPRGFP